VGLVVGTFGAHKRGLRGSRCARLGEEEDSRASKAPLC
jgi:hypothetical protein